MNEKLKIIFIIGTAAFTLQIKGLAQRTLQKDEKLSTQKTMQQKKQIDNKEEKNKKAELSNVQQNKSFSPIETKKIEPSPIAQAAINGQEEAKDFSEQKKKKSIPSPCHFIEILEHVDISFPLAVPSRGKDHATCAAKIEMRRTVGRNFLAVTSPTGTIIVKNLKKLILDFHKLSNSQEQDIEIMIKKISKKNGKKEIILNDTQIINTKYKLEIWVHNKRSR